MENMTKRLYVGGISYDTIEETLKNLFSQAGSVVSVKIITDRMTGRSSGFGFVEMSSEEEAKKAIETLNGKEVDGRNIIVDEARPPESRQRSRGFNRGGGHGFGGNRKQDW